MEEYIASLAYILVFGVPMFTPWVIHARKTYKEIVNERERVSDTVEFS